MIRVFILGPYDDDASLEVRQTRTEAMLEVFHQLMDAGFAPYCPLWTHYAHEYRSRTRKDWLALAAEWLAACDCGYMMPACLIRLESAAWAEADNMRLMSKPVFSDLNTLKAAYNIGAAVR